MTTGWLKLHRQITEWAWYDDGNTFRVFIHLLLTANFENKNWHGTEIKRGQLITSVDSIKSGLNRERKKNTISTQQIRTALDHLKSTKEVTIETTPNYTIVTINKFEEYQEVTNLVTNDQQTSNKRVTTTKEYKNIKNDNKEPYNEELTNQIEEIISSWNKNFGGIYKSTKERSANIAHHLKTKSTDQIKKAIKNLRLRRKYDPGSDFWDSIGIDTFFRQQNKSKESIDYVGDMFAYKPKVDYVTLSMEEENG